MTNVNNLLGKGERVIMTGEADNTLTNLLLLASVSITAYLISEANLLGFIGFTASGIFLQQILIQGNKRMTLTNKRVILQSGVLSRTIEDVKLEKIEGVYLTQGLINGMTGRGEITIANTSEKDISIHNYPAPHMFRELTNELLEDVK